MRGMPVAGDVQTVSFEGDAQTARLGASDIHVFISPVSVFRCRRFARLDTPPADPSRAWLFISPVSVCKNRRFERLTSCNSTRAFISPVSLKETGVLHAPPDRLRCFEHLDPPGGPNRSNRHIIYVVLGRNRRFERLGGCDGAQMFISPVSIFRNRRFARQEASARPKCSFHRFLFADTGEMNASHPTSRETS